MEEPKDSGETKEEESSDVEEEEKSRDWAALSFSFIVQQPISRLSAWQTTISTIFAIRLQYYMICQEFKKQSTRAHSMQESHKGIFVYQIQLILTLGSMLSVMFGQSTVKHLCKV